MFIINCAHSKEIIIRSGDVLQIELPGEVDFEKSFQVKRDGTITLPEIGKLFIADQSLAQVTKELEDRLGQEYRAINIDTVQDLLTDKKVLKELTIELLIELRLAHANDFVKILGRGKLDSPIKVTAHKFSASAKAAIEAAGGEALTV